MAFKLLIVCDIRLYREGLARSLERRGWSELAGTHVSPAEVLARVAQHRPELVLLDMAGTESRPVLERVLGEAPGVRVVALGVEERPETVLGLLEAGAAGYVPRDATVDDLVAALEAVARGEVVCSPRIAGSLVRRVAALAGDRPPESPMDGLTQREREILDLIERGHSNKQIARAIGVKVSTVKNHVHHILDKLGVSRRGAAAALARRPVGAGSGPGPSARGATDRPS